MTRRFAPSPVANSASSLFTVLLACLALSCGDEPEANAGPVDPTREQLLAVVDLALGAAEPVIRAESVRVVALADLPDLRSRVRDAIGDDHPMVRTAAAEASFAAGVEQTGDVLLRRLGSGPIAQREEALDLIIRLGPPALVRRALDQVLLQSAALRARAFRLLELRSARWDPEMLSAEFLERLIEDDRPFVPRVVEALLAMGRRDALDRVHHELMSEDREERWRALTILTSAPSPDAWPQLRWTHQRGATPEDRELAAIALARLGDPAVHDELHTVVEARHSPRRLAAARALAQVAREDDRETLRRLAQNDDPATRAAAIDGLAALGFRPEDVLPFVDESDVDVLASLIAHLQRSESGPGGLLCDSLRVAAEPEPLLLLLWLARAEGATRESYTECPGPLAELRENRDADVAALANRLIFWVDGVDPAWALSTDAGNGGAARTPILRSGVFERAEVLYAYLESSLGHDPAPFVDLYRESFAHELLPVRLIASLGFLRSGIQARD